MTCELASVAGAVIQATGRLILEDGLRPLSRISGPEGVSLVRTTLYGAGLVLDTMDTPEGSANTSRRNIKNHVLTACLVAGSNPAHGEEKMVL